MVRKRADHPGKPTRVEMDRFITICITNGWTVRHHTHPKTRARWIKGRQGLTVST